MKCPFCNIDADKTQIIAKRGEVYVALSNPRLVPGHLLVIPKRHVENFVDLNESESNSLWQTIQEFQNRILTYAPGCDLRQNYRPFIPDFQLKVSHMHFHLIPRFLEDELYKRCQIYEKDIFKALSLEEMETFFKMFKD